MENSDNQNQEIIFSENIGQILTNVLKKYKLEETDDEVFKKLETDQLFLGEIVMNITRSFILGKIQEKDFPVLLQQKLSISKEDAGKLFVEIKTNIVPLSKKISFEELEKQEETIEKAITTDNIINLPIDKNRDSFLQTEKKSSDNLYSVKRPPVSETVIETKSPILKRASDKPPKKDTIPKKTDIYQESID